MAGDVHGRRPDGETYPLPDTIMMDVRIINHT